MNENIQQINKLHEQYDYLWFVKYKDIAAKDKEDGTFNFSEIEEVKENNRKLNLLLERSMRKWKIRY